MTTFPSNPTGPFQNNTLDKNISPPSHAATYEPGKATAQVKIKTITSARTRTESINATDDMNEATDSWSKSINVTTDDSFEDANTSDNEANDDDAKEAVDANERDNATTVMPLRRPTMILWIRLQMVATGLLMLLPMTLQANYDAMAEVTDNRNEIIKDATDYDTCDALDVDTK